MSATEIIEQIKTLPHEERRKVYQFVSRDVGGDPSLYDDFALLGENAEASDVEFAWPAQAEVIRNGRA